MIRRFLTALIILSVLALPSSAALRINNLNGFNVRTVASVAAMTITETHNATDLGNATTYSFSSVSFGAAAGRSFVIVVACALDAAGFNEAGTNAIGSDSTATLVIEGIETARPCAIYTGTPTGTSGTVSLTLDDAGTAMGITAYRVTGGSEAAALTASNTADPVDIDLNIVAGGIYAAACFALDGTSLTWTGLTEDYEVDLEAGDIFGAASTASATAQTPLAVRCDASGAPGDMVGVGATWSP